MFLQSRTGIIAHADNHEGPTVTAAQVVDWVATQESLEPLVALLADAPLIGIDTEFVREKTYYPQLCLIQIATPEHSACVDCLAPLDFAPLYEQLFRPNCTWIVHSARQDLEVIWQRTGRMPPQLVDTQMAAALSGRAPQIGLEDLLAQTLGVELGESYARTDWSRRPLPAPAVSYALDDVRYLHAAWERLEGGLTELGRLEWLREDVARVLGERPEADVLTIWTRLKGVHTLPFGSQTAALALVRWRELAAQRADRPRRWLLADEALIAIAAALPRSITELCAVVQERFAARNGESLLAALATSEDRELQESVRANPGQEAADKKVVKALQESVRARAKALGLEPEILATRRDLAALAAGNPPPHLVSGWRAAQLAGISAPK
jgi:ribonuclease D